MTSLPKPIPHLGLYPYTFASEDIAKANGLEESSKSALWLEMAGAIAAGKLQTRVEATGGPADTPTSFVRVQDVNTWLSANEYPYTWIADGSCAIQKNNVFQKMDKLTPEEISITFVGVKSDSGMGNNMLEISARGVKERVPLTALNLVDGRKGALDSQGAILLAMTKKNCRLLAANKNSQKMTRLRQKLQTYFGISSDPFCPFNSSYGWEPKFKIEDKIGAADERAKAEAERKTVSLDQRNESGEKDTTDYEYDETNENDAAAVWLKEKERKSNK